jgi:hypothetical protein
MYFVGEVEEGSLLMVSLEWMVHVVGEIGYRWWRAYSNT